MPRKRQIRATKRAETILAPYRDDWLRKPLYSKLEDAVKYQGHSEICGCWETDTEHVKRWSIRLELLETEVRALMTLLNEQARRNTKRT